MFAEVQCERRLSHAGASGHDDELGRLEAPEHVVELVETGANSGRRVLVLGPQGDPVHGLGDDILQLDRLAADLLLGDGEDPLLGQFQQLVGRQAIGVAFAEDHIAAFDDLALDSLLPDDLGVVSGIGRVRNRRDDLFQQFLTADLAVDASSGEVLGQSDRINGAAEVV